MISNDKGDKLVRIYFFIYDRFGELKYYCEWFSNYNQPELTDQEKMTIYLYVMHQQGHFKVNHIRRFASEYLISWFPKLGSYRAFNNRLNGLTGVMYVANEKYDGYIRDNCLWRDNIDIFDKMSVQIKYANNVNVSYFLTTYSPFEGLTVAFNGMKGRIDTWQDLPWREKELLDQAKKHTREMSQAIDEDKGGLNEIMVSDNFGKTELIKVPLVTAGHVGGDTRLLDRLFRNPGAPDPYKHAAGSRDGVMSTLLGIAARKSILENRGVRIEELTDIKPHPSRGV